MRKLLVVLGIPIDNLSMDEALARCDEFIAAGRASGRTFQIATVNADFVVNSLHDPELRRILQEADMATADGMPLVWASRLLGGRIPGRVTGADMVPALAKRAAEKGYSVFFLGARPGVAAQAAEILQRRYPGLKVAGVYSPPSASVLEMDRTPVDLVKTAQPDILFVAFGNPKQEKWIRMFAPELPVPLAIGIGGTLDMIVGVTKRAPVWMQQIGLEWAYRLIQEPRRLLRRYLHDFGYFGYFLIQQWWAMRKGTAISMIPGEPDSPEKPDLLDTDVTTEAAGESKTTVLRPQGRIDVTNSDRFVEEARGALQKSPHLIISLRSVAFLDSTALGALVALANQARAAGGTLYLVEVPKPLMDLLTLVRLQHFFEVLASPESVEHQRSMPPSSPTPIVIPNGWAIIKAPRIFDAGTAPLFTERCTEQLIELPRLVIDLSETVFIASAGMAAMIKLDRTAKDYGGSLRIACCSPDVLRTLKMVKLDTILGVFETTDEAIAMPLGGEQASPLNTALPARS